MHSRLRASSCGPSEVSDPATSQRLGGSFIKIALSSGNCSGLASLLGANWELETGEQEQCQMCPLLIMIYHYFPFSSNPRQPGRQEALWRPSLQLQQAGQTSDQRQWCCHGQVQAQAVPADWRGENYLDLILVFRKMNFDYFRTSGSRWWRPTCG